MKIIIALLVGGMDLKFLLKFKSTEKTEKDSKKHVINVIRQFRTEGPCRFFILNGYKSQNP